MDEIVYIPTLVIGTLCGLWYFFSCQKKSQTVSVAVLVNVFLSASGISVGAFLILSTVVAQLKEKLIGVNLYIFIAGLVVMVVSAQAINSEIKK